jgi:hypothetical protein
MSDRPSAWELVAEDHGGLRRLERIVVPGGYLYELRIYTLAEGDTEPALCHASIEFVPRASNGHGGRGSEA